MSLESKRVTGICVPPIVDLAGYEPRSESIGLPSRDESTKIHRTNSSPSLPFSEEHEKSVLSSLIQSVNEVAALYAASLQPDASYISAHQIIYPLIYRPEPTR
jgi:hypothetical protein